MNTNNTKTKVGLLLLSLLFLTGCGTYDETVRGDTATEPQTTKQTKLTHRLLKEIQIKKIYEDKDKKTAEIESELSQDKKGLATKTEVELEAQRKLLLSKTQKNIRQLKTQAQQDKTTVIISVEQEIANTASQTESALVKQLLDSEFKSMSNFVKKEIEIDAEHTKELTHAEYKLNITEEEKIAILEKDVRNHRKYNQDLLILKSNELERIRIEIAMYAKQKAISENNMTLSKLQDKYEEDVVKRIDAVKKSLSDKRKATLTKLQNEYTGAKSQRKATNEKRLKALGYKNKEVKQAAGDKKRSGLEFVRKAELTSIETNLQAGIEQAKTDEKQSLIDIRENLNTKLSDAVKKLEDAAIQKKEYLSAQAQKAENRVIDEYNERKRLAKR